MESRPFTVSNIIYKYCKNRCTIFSILNSIMIQRVGHPCFAPHDEGLPKESGDHFPAAAARAGGQDIGSMPALNEPDPSPSPASAGGGSKGG